MQRECLPALQTGQTPKMPPMSVSLDLLAGIRPVMTVHRSSKNQAELKQICILYILALQICNNMMCPARPQKHQFNNEFNILKEYKD